MKRLLPIVLFGAIGCANAGTWTVGGDVGPSRLDSRHHDDADVDTGAALALRVGWWFTPNFALEGGFVHADTGYRTAGADIDRDMTSLLLGGRAQVAIGDRSFVYMRGGYAQHRIDTEEPRIVGGTTTLVEDDSDAGHYLGVGLGWRWNQRWSSSVELARLYGDVAYGCDATGCATTHSSYFDLITVGLTYEFD